MKKSIFILSFLCFIFSTSFAHTDPLVIIRGSVSQEGMRDVTLYKAVEGAMVEWQTSRIDKKQFAFALTDPDEGFYYVGSKEYSGFLKHRFYVKKGEQIKLTIGDDAYTIEGQSPENKLLNEWHQVLSPIFYPSYNFWNDRTGYVTFFPELKSFLPKAAAFKSSIKSKDNAFKERFSYIIDNDIESAVVYFLMTPRVAQPTKEEFPDYVNNIYQKNKYCSTRILQLGDGLSRVSIYSTFAYSRNPDRNKADYLKTMTSAICNDTLKGYLVLNALERYKSLEAMETAIKPFEQYFVTDSLKARYQRSLSDVASFSKGEKGYEFNYPDINNKNVSFSSLKGKVVFIDTWATWCMPCKEQIPYLKKLEEELKNENIAFVSISVDEVKDKQKWIDMVKKENLGGIQLFAGGWSEFAQYYKIQGIPRFMIFDQNGKIVDVDSPRPSESSLKDLLLKIAKGS